MSLSNIFNTSDDSGLPAFGSMEDHSSLHQNAISSPMSIFDETLLSPANISFGSMMTPSTSTRSEGCGPTAYTQLLGCYQQSEAEWAKLQQELNTLKASHQKLLEAHNVVVVAYIDSTKRPRAEDSTQLPSSGGAVAKRALGTDSEEARPDRLLSSDYPCVKYWTKSKWLDFRNSKKNTSIQGSKAGPRGGTRCAQGENVSMQYLEDTDGNPINGCMAASIREYARTIWADFHQRGIAPERWNSAVKRVRDEYAIEMENQWPVLHYCDNHWKSHAIMTSNYPQWLKNRLQKSDKLARKRHKSVLENDENAQPEFETNANCLMLKELDGGEDENEDEDSNTSMSFPVAQDDQDEPRTVTSRPCARPLMPQDPLVDVFAESSRTPYHIVAPLSLPQPQAVPMQGPGMPPPVAPLPLPVVLMQGPGMPPPVAPLPLPLTPSPLHTSAPPDSDCNALSSSTGRLQKAANQKRYTYMMLLKPGSGISAKNICAADWLKKNPRGKTGEFNRYWDHGIDPTERAAYYEREAAEEARIQTQDERKKRGLLLRRVTTCK